MQPSTPSGFSPRPFRPAAWARGPHAQTLLARALRFPHDPGMSRERWDTPDGDFLDVDLGPDPAPHAPIALVLHGLEGSSRRKYILHACDVLLRSGIRPVAMNFRGCGGGPNRLPRFYHSGESSDPAFALDQLHARFPDRRFGVLGFSLGANMLLKMLGERDDGGVGLVDAAVAISTPFDLAAGCALLETTRMGRLYTTYFLRSLRRKLVAKRALLEPLIDVETALTAPTLYAFDEAATAPLHGFRSAAHYYTTCSSSGFLGRIRVPTLVLQSLDDPFLPSESVPRNALCANPAIEAVLTPSGGHVGFLAGTPWRPNLWGEAEGARFLAQFLRDSLER